MSWEGALVKPITAEADAFASFYRSNYEAVHRAAVAFCGDREIAIDATQESFARAYARWNKLCRKSWAGAWVVTTALNVCRRSLRTARPRHELPPPHAADDAGLERVDLLRALRRLPHRRRLAAVLFYIGDYSIADVARAMGISEGAVKAHLSIARGELRKEMGRR
jgi:RNA polymerase sigma-70 factor (ECF subfamily)